MTYYSDFPIYAEKISVHAQPYAALIKQDDYYTETLANPNLFLKGFRIVAVTARKPLGVVDWSIDRYLRNNHCHYQSAEHLKV